MKRHTFLPRLAAIAALLLAAASFTSCEDDESTLGIDLVDPATLYAPKYDTLYPDHAWSQIEDSLLTSTIYAYSIVGNLVDPIFGRTSAELFAQVALPEDVITLDFSGLQIDSVVMSLVKHQLHPDTAATYRMHFEVKQLAEAVESDRRYYSTDELPVQEDKVLYDGTVSVGYTDSVVRLHLDTEVAKQMLTQADSASAFIATAKGLRVRIADDSGNGMMSIDFSSTATCITIYYHYTIEDEVRTGSYDFLMGAGTAFFTHFKHDYSGTVLAAADSVDGSNRLYLEPLGGHCIHLNFDRDLRTFHEEHPLAVIHHAELRLPLASESSSLVPDKLIIMEKAGMDSLVPIDDMIDMYTLNGFDGTYHADLGYYRLRVTQHLQGLLRQGNDKGMIMLIDKRRHTTSHAIVNGTADKATSPKIVFVYTESNL